MDLSQNNCRKPYNNGLYESWHSILKSMQNNAQKRINIYETFSYVFMYIKYIYDALPLMIEMSKTEADAETETKNRTSSGANKTNSGIDYETYLRDKEYGEMCKRSYNRVAREENLEHLLAKA